MSDASGLVVVDADVELDMQIDVQQALSTFNRKQFHHIFPRGHLKKAKEEDDNLLLNICLLPAAANLKISDQDPNKYLPQLQADLGGSADVIFASNMLPEPSSFDYSTASYEDFIAARLKIMRDRVGKLCDGKVP